MDRRPGPSVRLKLTLSYAGFLIIAGAVLLGIVWVFLLRYVPPEAARTFEAGFFPGRGDLARAFFPAAAWALAFLLVFGLAGGWLLAGRMLSPLDRIARATRLAAQGSLSHRIELPGHADEFREFADGFDVMLSRLEAHVAEQQRFAANASHELRTPLAITQALLDVARADPQRDVGALLDRLHAVNARAIALTEALLTLSRAQRAALTAEAVDLSLLAEDAAETLLPLAEKRGIAIDVAGDATSALGSPVLLAQLVTNLVHNAIVHNVPAEAATGGSGDGPGSGRVWITARADPDAAILTVENTGAPLDPALVTTLTEPFRRGGGRARDDHGGVGLGLAIASRIAEAHGGSLALEARRGGGLKATVRLPAPTRR
ncbi:sensor histidine kinase [Leucobacter massiliensis]|uniref:histidine kinase n=1 Tax=Leucobacter massiliensis TaxID=1686285 RepID=A0A2S9QR38_9MICO|nr:HAMP domain-containing sensor histidine kinase [Leucobacter massiliensis]PRI12049.1 two-component sensor histidine kinase [Leucobacter massiliensis]